MKESSFRLLCYMSMSFLWLILIVICFVTYSNNKQLDTIRKNLLVQSMSSQSQNQFQSSDAQRLNNLQTQINDMRTEINYLKGQINSLSQSTSNNRNPDMQTSINMLNRRVNRLESESQNSGGGQ